MGCRLVRERAARFTIMSRIVANRRNVGRHRRVPQSHEQEMSAMGHRRVSICCLLLGAAAVVASFSAHGAALAQAKPASGAGKYTVPKTSWGQPDLQGVWTTD